MSLAHWLLQAQIATNRRRRPAVHRCLLCWHRFNTDAELAAHERGERVVSIDVQQRGGKR